jgi:hypothetical protein
MACLETSLDELKAEWMEMFILTKLTGAYFAYANFTTFYACDCNINLLQLHSDKFVAKHLGINCFSVYFS